MNTEKLVELALKLRVEAFTAEEKMIHALDKWAHAVYPHKVGDVVKLPDNRATKSGRVTAISGDWERSYIDSNGLHTPVVRVSYKPLRVDGSDANHYGKNFFWKPEA